MRLRQALLVATTLAVCACGKTVPRYSHRTAPEWVDRLSSPIGEEVTEAADALANLAKSEPAAVMAALEAGLLRVPRPPDGIAMSLMVDEEAGLRLGLSKAARDDSVQGALPVLRSRLQGLGLVPASLKANLREEFDVVAPGARSLPEAQRLQALLSTRAAFDLRVLARDPAAGAPEGAYDGAVPYPRLRLEEARRYVATAAKGEAYVPTDPRWRVVPRAGTPAQAPEDFEVVTEPTEPKDALDERMIASATGGATADGTPTLTIATREDRVADVKRVFAGARGGALGMILDGVLVARGPVPAFDGGPLTLAAGPREKDAVTARAHARDLAVLVAGGRLPWPLKPVPLGDRYSADPPPDMPIAKVFAALGPQALPSLRRIADGDGPPWGKAAARWAIDHVAP